MSGHQGARSTFLSLTDERPAAYPPGMSINYGKILSERLLALRKQKPGAADGLSEAEAKQLKRMEQAKVSPRLESIQWAAGLYGVHVTQLLGAENGPPPPAAPEMDDRTRALLTDYEALPAGWQYYIARKACELREIADKLPPFLRASLKTIPEASTYWQWEKELDSYIREQKGVVDTDDYTGTDRRSEDVGHKEERRHAVHEPKPRYGDKKK